MSIPLISSPNLSCKSQSISNFRRASLTKFYCFRSEEFLKFRSKSNLTIGLSLSSQRSLVLCGRRNVGFLVSAGNVEGEPKSVVDEAEESMGESTMPSRFRYLTKEAPDRPLRWPWLVALAFVIYTWRTVLWEFSNWVKAIQVIVRSIGYILKLTLAIVFHFIGDPITNLIRFIENACYSVQSMYSSTVVSSPVGELAVIILLTSAVLAIAETLAPDSVRSQPYLLTFAGVIGFAAATDIITELFFWVLLVGLFCFALFVKKRDYVQSALPVAAALTAVGTPFVRFTVMASFLALAISHHSQLPQENLHNGAAAKSISVPFPLVAAAMAIGIQVAFKWIRYRN